MPRKQVTMRVNMAGWTAVLTGDDVAHLVREKCEEIVETAIRVFEKRVRHTGPPTNPPYTHAFDIERLGFRFRIVNHDPVANLIEFGAHPGGGPTFTLRYRPLGTAIEILSIE